MLEPGSGDLLTAEVDALVNAVNCVGVMGKGIALAFKQQFPTNYRAYRTACQLGEVRLGRVFVVELASSTPRYVVNFPTKQHWRCASRLSDIEAGLADLVRVIDQLGIGSIAVPALGAGNGGLAWERVKPLIEAAAHRLGDVRVVVFPPLG